MGKTLSIIILFIYLISPAFAYIELNKSDHFYAGVGAGFPVRYSQNKLLVEDDLSGLSDEFPYISLHYFFQYAPFQITEHAFFGAEFGGMLTSIGRNDDQNERVSSLYAGVFLDVKKFLELKIGMHSTDFEIRNPKGDRGFYYGGAYNFWRGDGARLQLDYRLHKANRLDNVEGEFANILINLVVSYRKFIN